MDILEQVASVVAAADFGSPSARKTGRNPQWPYVPVIQHTEGGKRGDGYQEQILGKAYAERDEAVAAAQAAIDALRSDLADKLVQPRFRALREQYGLPRELDA